MHCASVEQRYADLDGYVHVRSGGDQNFPRRKATPLHVFGSPLCNDVDASPGILRLLATSSVKGLCRDEWSTVGVCARLPQDDRARAPHLPLPQGRGGSRNLEFAWHMSSSLDAWFQRYKDCVICQLPTCIMKSHLRRTKLLRRSLVCLWGNNTTFISFEDEIKSCRDTKRLLSMWLAVRYAVVNKHRKTLCIIFYLAMLDLRAACLNDCRKMQPAQRIFPSLMDVAARAVINEFQVYWSSPRR